MNIELDHQELNILLFALEGADVAAALQQTAEPSCEDSCPIVDHLDDLFGMITPEKRLVNHLNNHLREGMLECGFLDVMEKWPQTESRSLSAEDHIKMQQVTERLQSWRCEIKISEEEQQVLRAAFQRLPRSAWVSMPRTLRRLRKKIHQS